MSKQIKIFLVVGIVLIVVAGIGYFAVDCGGEETAGQRGVTLDTATSPDNAE